MRSETKQSLAAATNPSIAKYNVSKLKTPPRIFTYWDYPDGPGAFVQMNIDSWRRHAPEGTEIVFVNDSNIKEWVPDVPGEYFRLPYAAVKSDFVRCWVLYHHGGLYMDTDFLVNGPLYSVFATLDKGWDVVVYTDSGESSGECNDVEPFSSNFIGARAGNPFHATWKHNMKHKMTRLCGEGEYGIDKACCHEAFAKLPEKRSCHVPWGHLEWLKDPKRDADGPRHHNEKKEAKLIQLQKLRKKRTSPEELAILAKVDHGMREAKKIPNSANRYCLRGIDRLAPHLNGEVYWQPWDERAKVTQNELIQLEGGTGPKDVTRSFDGRFDCRELDGSDLDCDRGNWGGRPRFFPKFFDRIAYHLFFSTFIPKVTTVDEVLGKPWLLSELYRRSQNNNNNFNIGLYIPEPPARKQVPV